MKLRGRLVSKNSLRARWDINPICPICAIMCFSYVSIYEVDRWENTARSVDKIQTSSGRMIWKFVGIYDWLSKISAIEIDRRLYIYIFFFSNELSKNARSIDNSRAKLRQSSSLSTRRLNVSRGKSQYTLFPRHFRGFDFTYRQIANCIQRAIRVMDTKFDCQSPLIEITMSIIICYDLGRRLISRRSKSNPMRIKRARAENKDSHL